jgi:hypothetical protein
VGEQPLELEPLRDLPPAASVGVALIAGVVLTGFTVPIGATLGCLAGIGADLLGAGGVWTVGAYGGAYLALAWSLLAVRDVVGRDLGVVTGGQAIDRRVSSRHAILFETAAGVTTALGPDHDVPELDSAFTLGGFDLATPNRQSARREVVRTVVAGVCALAAWVGIAIGVHLYFGWDTLLGHVQFALVWGSAVLIPVGVLRVLMDGAWLGRRVARWTDRITLEGAVLRTDRGTFHVRGPVDVERGVDDAGSWMTLSDDTQSLTFGAPHVALSFVVRQLARVERREGDADEVPDALRRMSSVVGEG